MEIGRISLSKLPFGMRRCDFVLILVDVERRYSGIDKTVLMKCLREDVYSAMNDYYMDVSENSGTPQIIHFNRVFHYKPSILGYPYVWKHLFTTCQKFPT